MKRLIVMLTIVCVLCSSLEMRAFAQTAAEETGISQEQIQQTVSSGEITVSDGDDLARSMARNLEMEATDESAFRYKIDEAGNAIVTGYTGTDTEVVVPDMLGGSKVTKIDDATIVNTSKS